MGGAAATSVKSSMKFWSKLQGHLAGSYWGVKPPVPVNSIL